MDVSCLWYVWERPDSGLCTSRVLPVCCLSVYWLVSSMCAPYLLCLPWPDVHFGWAAAHKQNKQGTRKSDEQQLFRFVSTWASSFCSVEGSSVPKKGERWSVMSVVATNRTSKNLNLYSFKCSNWRQLHCFSFDGNGKKAQCKCLSIYFFILTSELILNVSLTSG